MSLKILFENNDFILGLDEEIVLSRYKTGVIIDQNVSSLAIKKRLELFQAKNQYVISDGSKIKYWTMSSRNNDMKEYAFKHIIKAAVVLPNSGIKALWFLATKLSPPPIPLKTFLKYDDAKKWIISERKKDYNPLK